MLNLTFQFSVPPLPAVLCLSSVLKVYLKLNISFSKLYEIGNSGFGIIGSLIFKRLLRENVLFSFLSSD